MLALLSAAREEFITAVEFVWINGGKAESTIKCHGGCGVTMVDALGGAATGGRATLALDKGGVEYARHGRVGKGDNYFETSGGTTLSGGGSDTGGDGDDVCTGASGGGGNVVSMATEVMKKESFTS
ncbi:hypothetical protein GUJ93_ZPchr0012g19045 [Zizania palustris]|uniref:Uncharacterized protein n=1 Tax=Zizania palustris TaxID=103762 RepID=A0A8J5WQQ0_ZIZPA|nr:hypothetical protein GUJ93_ZPchr0012g19045 [Zizania palustris]